MKKILTVLLACLLIVSLVGCGGNKEEATDTSADTTAPVTEAPEADAPSEEEAPKEEENAPEVTVKINSTTENVRFFGEKEVKSENYLNCNTAASGFEVKVKTVGGKFNVRVITTGNIYFRAWVDGVAQKSSNGSEYFSILGSRLIELNDIPNGEHTIRILRVSDGTDTAQIYAATFKGEHLAIDTADKYYIEFLGDEITSGNMIGEGRDDVSLAYSYLAADKLGADIAVTTFEKAGVSTEGTFDLYAAGERLANMVVINIGKYDADAKLGVNDFIAKYKALIKNVKLANGADCKIVCVVTHDNAEYDAAIKSMVDSLGGNSYGYFYLGATTKTADALTAAQHSAFATELSAYISQIKDMTVEINKLHTGTVGTGDSLGYGSEEWKPVV